MPKWVENRYDSLTGGQKKARYKVQPTIPLYDPHKKAPRTRKLSAYDVVRKNNPDMKARFEADAKLMYPDDACLRYAYVNRKFKEYLNEEQEYYSTLVDEENEEREKAFIAREGKGDDYSRAECVNIC